MRVYCPTGSNTALSRTSVMYPMMRCPHRQQQQPLPRSATLRRRRRVLELAAIRRRLLCLLLGDPPEGLRLLGACRIKLGGLIWILSMRAKAKKRKVKRARTKKVRKRRARKVRKRKRTRKRGESQGRKVIDSRGRKSTRFVGQVYCGLQMKRTGRTAM